MIATTFNTILVKSYEEFFNDYYLTRKIGVADCVLPFDLEIDTTNKTDLEKIQSLLEFDEGFLYNVNQLASGEYMINCLDLNIYFSFSDTKKYSFQFAEDGLNQYNSDGDLIDVIDSVDQNYNTLVMDSDLESNLRVNEFYEKLTDREKKYRLKKIFYSELEALRKLTNTNIFNDGQANLAIDKIYNDPRLKHMICRGYYLNEDLELLTEKRCNVSTFEFKAFKTAKNESETNNTDHPARVYELLEENVVYFNQVAKTYVVLPIVNDRNFTRAMFEMSIGKQMLSELVEVIK